MKKGIFVVSILLAVLLSSVVAFAQSLCVTINGAEATLEHAPLQQGGQVLLPLDDIFYALGGRVQYNSRAGAAAVTLDNGSSVWFKEHECSITVNGSKKSLSTAPVKQDGVLYIPLDGVAAVAGCTARFDGATVAIVEAGYQFGLDAVRLYRPEEHDTDTGVVLEEYSIDIPIDPDVFEYTQVVTKDRIPVVSVLKEYYGIDYKVTQAYKKRPTAIITLERDGMEYVYKINFLEQ